MSEAAYRQFRASVFGALVSELFGPLPNDARGNEILEDLSPLQRYGVGILFPQASAHDSLERNDRADTPASEDREESIDAGEDDLETPEIDDESDSEGPETNSDPPSEALNLANEYSPSAVGLTFRLPLAPTKLRVNVSLGVYKLDPDAKVPHPRAGQLKADGTPYPDTKSVKHYHRKPIQAAIHLLIDPSVGSLPRRLPTAPIDGTDGLVLETTIRRGQQGSVLVSMMLVNTRQRASDTPRAEDAYFQVEFEVQEQGARPVFLPIDRVSGLVSEEEAAEMDLLYRHRRSFALGHGCAGDWNRENGDEELAAATLVRTEPLPSYETFPVIPREAPHRVHGVNRSMIFLARGEGPDDGARHASILASLRALCDDYEQWIKDREGEASKLTGVLNGAAERHLRACHACLLRMRAGCSRLQADPVALQAFRLANLAMAIQQFHTDLELRALGTATPELPRSVEEYANALEGRPKGKWRLFQLAFLLMNVEGVVSESCPDRLLVDLIWFPTGGGKTEAYLGLTAFVICLRRLKEPAHAATTVLMRYTLRLLTAQQFERSCALVLALEYMRQNKQFGATLGTAAISMGLWVGSELTPNTRAGAVSMCNDLNNPEKGALRRFNNRFQLLSCPWCRIKFDDPAHYGYRVERIAPKEVRQTVRYRCPDENCPWGKARTRLPVSVVDEDIYAEPPTIVLGTVDKFAQVTWREETARLFGIGSRQSPELIIQDELHLISGPLGTIVGLYETAIEELCSHAGRRPKIVASTATIRRASEQCRALYNRAASEFPPPGLRAGDSYFASEDRQKPGRLYVGVHASGLKSHATSQVRCVASLLQGVRSAPIPAGAHPDEMRDPYGSLVWYFNSLRALGHAVTLCSGDIPEHIAAMCRREKAPMDTKRRLWVVEELTSRRTANEIPRMLEALMRRWTPTPEKPYPVDVLLASSMLSVGVDIPRLALMVVTTQPKTTAEYIQATSRVGRKYPGLVVTIYDTSKPRDRSHYEQFVSYHQSIYRFVEPTSVTPFSTPARERGLKGVLVAVARHLAGVEAPTQIGTRRTHVERLAKRIVDRVRSIDPGEAAAAEAELDDALREWRAVVPPQYGKMGGKVDTVTLLYPYGERKHPIFQQRSWPTLTSMRNVDRTSEARVQLRYDPPAQAPEDAESDEGEVAQ